MNCVYARVSTQKQKTDLANQVDKLKSFCYAKGVQIGGLYKDIGNSVVKQIADRGLSFNPVKIKHFN